MLLEIKETYKDIEKVKIIADYLEGCLKQMQTNMRMLNKEEE